MAVVILVARFEISVFENLRDNLLCALWQQESYLRGRNNQARDFTVLNLLIRWSQLAFTPSGPFMLYRTYITENDAQTLLLATTWRRCLLAADLTA